MKAQKYPQFSPAITVEGRNVVTKCHTGAILDPKWLPDGDAIPNLKNFLDSW